MNTELDQGITEQWESGKLGTERANQRVAGAEIEAALDGALAMKLVTIRLPIPLIEALKAIAQHHGVGYQPMVRDLLGRFALSEFHTLMREKEDTMKALQQQSEPSPPVDAFMERERHAASG